MSALPAIHGPHEARARAFSAGLALVASAAVVAGGLAGPRPLPVVGWAAAFVFFAVEGDARARRIPNRLTFPALALALVYAQLAAGPSGFTHALLGVAAAFGALLVPYAVGALGAGDVKAAMVLGALFGPAATAALLAFAIGFGGLLALAHVAASGEAREILRRWSASVATSVAARRWVFFAAPAGSAADAGVPFGVALGFAVAAELAREALR